MKHTISIFILTLSTSFFGASNLAGMTSGEPMKFASDLHRACFYGDVKAVAQAIPLDQRIGQCNKDTYNIGTCNFNDLYSQLTSEDEGMIDSVDINLCDFDGNTPLHLACQNGHVECVLMLLKHSDIDVNIQNKNENTPLHLACINGRPSCVEALLKHSGIDINVKNEYGETPLLSAYKDCGEYYDPECVNIIIQSGLKFDINQTNRNDRTLGYIAACQAGSGCDSQYFDVLKIVINDPAFNVNACNEEQPLLHAAFEDYTHVREDTGVMDFLFASRIININMQDSEGRAIAHMICLEQYDANVLESLLDKRGDDTNLMLLSGENETPLMMAFRLRHGEHIKIIFAFFEKNSAAKKAYMQMISGNYDSYSKDFKSLARLFRTFFVVGLKGVTMKIHKGTECPVCEQPFDGASLVVRICDVEGNVSAVHGWCCPILSDHGHEWLVELLDEEYTERLAGAKRSEFKRGQQSPDSKRSCN